MTTHELVKPTSFFDFLFHVKRLESEIIFRTQKVARGYQNPPLEVYRVLPVVNPSCTNRHGFGPPCGQRLLFAQYSDPVSCSEIASMCSSLCTDPPYVFTLYYTYSLFSFCMLTLYVKLDVILYILYLSFPSTQILHCIWFTLQCELLQGCSAIIPVWGATSSQINSLPTMQLLTLRNLLN